MRSLYVVLTDERYNRLSQVPVELYSVQLDTLITDGMTDEDGKVSFVGLTEGEYIARPRGYQTKPMIIHYISDLNIRELFQADTLANRPAAGWPGRVYWTTDTGILYRDDGATWVKVAVRDHADLDGIGANDHHAQSHTHASHTSIGVNDHHNESHASRHWGAGADELNAEDLGTNDNITSHVAKSDGANGISMAQLTHAELASVTADQHHAQSHGHSSHSGIGTDDHHAISHVSRHWENAADQLMIEDLGANSLTTTHVAKASGTGGVDMGQLPHSSLSGIGTGDHHAQSHAINGGDHSGSLAHSALSGIGADDHHNHHSQGTQGSGSTTLTTTFADVTGLTLTAGVTATFLIMVDVSFELETGDEGNTLKFRLMINGVAQSGEPGYRANAATGRMETSFTWLSSVTSGQVVKVQAKKDAGTGASIVYGPNSALHIVAML